jgi:hypothetical protein
MNGRRWPSGLATVTGALLLTACLGDIGIPSLATRTAVPAGETAGPCAAAILGGRLVADPGGRLTVHPDGAPARGLRWPAGYRVRRSSAGLEVLDDRGAVVAREGAIVALRGGELGASGWDVCGVVDPTTLR